MLYGRGGCNTMHKVAEECIGVQYIAVKSSLTHRRGQ